jgi:hypothetical protein
MEFKKQLTLLVFFLLSTLVYGQLPKRGLYFYTHDRNIDERTSLILNGGDSYKLSVQDEWRLDFDFFLRDTDKGIKFGYIFRIISNNEKNFDFIINNASNAFLIIQNRDFQPKDKLLVEQWNHVSVTFNKKQNNISLRLNDEILDCPCDLKDVKGLHIGFGACEFKNFENSDVAPVILKDVNVFYNGKEWHRWILDKHGKNVVYDVLKNKPAIVRNPYWLMDNHIF